MERILVVSSNNSSDYYFYAKFLEKAWNSFGWRLAIVLTHDVNPNDLGLKEDGNTILISLPNIEGIRLETQAQAGRLYACNYLPENSLVMTSDMDMLPLSNYWNPSINDVTVYGHDLTWFSFIPMCYVAMSNDKWKRYMNLTGDTEKDFLRDANDRSVPHSPYEEDFEQRWNFDWSLLTQRLMPHKEDIKFINRGQIDLGGATLALGRVDRYNWDATLNGNITFVDAHLHNTSVTNPERLAQFLELFEKHHGKL